MYQLHYDKKVPMVMNNISSICVMTFNLYPLFVLMKQFYLFSSEKKLSSYSTYPGESEERAGSEEEGEREEKEGENDEEDSNESSEESSEEGEEYAQLVENSEEDDEYETEENDEDEEKEETEQQSSLNLEELGLSHFSIVAKTKSPNFADFEDKEEEEKEPETQNEEEDEKQIKQLFRNKAPSTINKNLGVEHFRIQIPNESYLGDHSSSFPRSKYTYTNPNSKTSDPETTTKIDEYSKEDVSQAKSAEDSTLLSAYAHFFSSSSGLASKVSKITNAKSPARVTTSYSVSKTASVSKQDTKESEDKSDSRRSRLGYKSVDYESALSHFLQNKGENHAPEPARKKQNIEEASSSESPRNTYRRKDYRKSVEVKESKTQSVSTDYLTNDQSGSILSHFQPATHNFKADLVSIGTRKNNDYRKQDTEDDIKLEIDKIEDQDKEYEDENEADEDEEGYEEDEESEEEEEEKSEEEEEEKSEEEEEEKSEEEDSEEEEEDEESEEEEEEKSEEEDSEEEDSDESSSEEESSEEDNNAAFIILNSDRVKSSSQRNNQYFGRQGNYVNDDDSDELVLFLPVITGKQGKPKLSTIKMLSSQFTPDGTALDLQHKALTDRIQGYIASLADDEVEYFIDELSDMISSDEISLISASKESSSENTQVADVKTSYNPFTFTDITPETKNQDHEISSEKNIPSHFKIQHISFLTLGDENEKTQSSRTHSEDTNYQVNKTETRSQKVSTTSGHNYASSIISFPPSFEPLLKTSKKSNQQQIKIISQPTELTYKEENKRYPITTSQAVPFSNIGISGESYYNAKLADLTSHFKVSTEHAKASAITESSDNIENSFASIADFSDSHKDMEKQKEIESDDGHISTQITASDFSKTASVSQEMNAENIKETSSSVLLQAFNVLPVSGELLPSNNVVSVKPVVKQSEAEINLTSERVTAIGSNIPGLDRSSMDTQKQTKVNLSISHPVPSATSNASPYPENEPTESNFSIVEENGQSESNTRKFIQSQQEFNLKAGETTDLQDQKFMHIIPLSAPDTLHFKVDLPGQIKSETPTIPSISTQILDSSFVDFNQETSSDRTLVDFAEMTQTTDSLHEEVDSFGNEVAALDPETTIISSPITTEAEFVSDTSDGILQTSFSELNLSDLKDTEQLGEISSIVLEDASKIKTSESVPSIIEGKALDDTTNSFNGILESQTDTIESFVDTVSSHGSVSVIDIEESEFSMTDSIPETSMSLSPETYSLTISNETEILSQEPSLITIDDGNEVSSPGTVSLIDIEESKFHIQDPNSRAVSTGTESLSPEVYSVTHADGSEITSLEPTFIGISEGIDASISAFTSIADSGNSDFPILEVITSKDNLEPISIAIADDSEAKNEGTFSIDNMQVSKSSNSDSVPEKDETDNPVQISLQIVHSEGSGALTGKPISIDGFERSKTSEAQFKTISDSEGNDDSLVEASSISENEKVEVLVAKPISIFNDEGGQIFHVKSGTASDTEANEVPEQESISLAVAGSSDVSNAPPISIAITKDDEVISPGQFSTIISKEMKDLSPNPNDTTVSQNLRSFFREATQSKPSFSLGNDSRVTEKTEETLPIKANIQETIKKKIENKQTSSSSSPTTARTRLSLAERLKRIQQLRLKSQLPENKPRQFTITLEDTSEETSKEVSSSTTMERYLKRLQERRRRLKQNLLIQQKAQGLSMGQQKDSFNNNAKQPVLSISSTPITSFENFKKRSRARITTEVTGLPLPQKTFKVSIGKPLSATLSDSSNTGQSTSDGTSEINRAQSSTLSTSNVVEKPLSSKSGSITSEIEFNTQTLASDKPDFSPVSNRNKLGKPIPSQSTISTTTDDLLPVINSESKFVNSASLSGDRSKGVSLPPLTTPSPVDFSQLFIPTQNQFENNAQINNLTSEIPSIEPEKVFDDLLQDSPPENSDDLLGIVESTSDDSTTPQVFKPTEEIVDSSSSTLLSNNLDNLVIDASLDSHHQSESEDISLGVLPLFIPTSSIPDSQNPRGNTDTSDIVSLIEEADSTLLQPEPIFVDEATPESSMFSPITENDPNLAPAITSVIDNSGDSLPSFVPSETISDTTSSPSLPEDTSAISDLLFALENDSTNSLPTGNLAKAISESGTLNTLSVGGAIAKHESSESLLPASKDSAIKKFETDNGVKESIIQGLSKNRDKESENISQSALLTTKMRTNFSNLLGQRQMHNVRNSSDKQRQQQSQRLNQQKRQFLNRQRQFHSSSDRTASNQQSSLNKPNPAAQDGKQQVTRQQFRVNQLQHLQVSRHERLQRLQQLRLLRLQNQNRSNQQSHQRAQNQQVSLVSKSNIQKPDFTHDDEDQKVQAIFLKPSSEQNKRQQIGTQIISVQESEGKSIQESTTSAPISRQRGVAHLRRQLLARSKNIQTSKPLRVNPTSTTEIQKQTSSKSTISSRPSFRVRLKNSRKDRPQTVLKTAKSLHSNSGQPQPSLSLTRELTPLEKHNRDVLGFRNPSISRLVPQRVQPKLSESKPLGRTPFRTIPRTPLNIRPGKRIQPDPAEMVAKTFVVEFASMLKRDDLEGRSKTEEARAMLRGLLQTMPSVVVEQIAPSLGKEFGKTISRRHVRVTEEDFSSKSDGESGQSKSRIVYFNNKPYLKLTDGRVLNLGDTLSVLTH